MGCHGENSRWQIQNYYHVVIGSPGPCFTEHAFKCKTLLPMFITRCGLVSMNRGVIHLGNALTSIQHQAIISNIYQCKLIVNFGPWQQTPLKFEKKIQHVSFRKIRLKMLLSKCRLFSGFIVWDGKQFVEANLTLSKFLNFVLNFNSSLRYWYKTLAVMCFLTQKGRRDLNGLLVTVWNLFRWTFKHLLFPHDKGC